MIIFFNLIKIIPKGLIFLKKHIQTKKLTIGAMNHSSLYEFEELFSHLLTLNTQRLFLIQI